MKRAIQVTMQRVFYASCIGRPYSPAPSPPSSLASPGPHHSPTATFSVCPCARLRGLGCGHNDFPCALFRVPDSRRFHSPVVTQ